MEVIATDGPTAVSLRELARKAGVSHAAPAHHFKDKAGLLTAIAIEGYEILADSLQDAFDAAPLPVLELGVRYVRFAIDYPAHFEVMYRPDLYHRDDPELQAGKQWARRVLRAGVATLPNTEGRRDVTTSGAVAAWSMAHGFATLWSTGNLDDLVEDVPPAELFRSIARVALPSLGHRP